MTRIGRRSVALYLVFMVALSAMGALNQDRLDRYTSLLDTKDERIVASGQLRGRAEGIRGPEAVARWAREVGMVAVPENGAVVYVDTIQSPVSPPLPSGLEVETRWR